jgi:Tfp pilus assembly protein PilX
MTATTQLRGRACDDSGVALLAAMGVVAVAMLFGLVVINIAVSTNRDSGRDRQRTVVVDAAEAGIDATYAQIQSSGTGVPCTSSGSVAANPDQPSYVVTVAYVATDGTQACPFAAGKVLDGALITSTATAAAPSGIKASRRTMQAYVRLTPPATLSNAISAGGTASFNNNTTVTGDKGPDANVYSNTGFSCANNESFEGSVFAQGSIGFSSSCSVTGDVWAKNSVASANGTSGNVGGRVLSSQGNINLSAGNLSVAGVLQAKGTISGGGCPNPAKCFPGAAVADPPYQPFPILRDDAAALNAWVGAGFTVNSTLTDCANPGGANNPTRWIVANAATLPAKTLVATPCKVSFSGATVKLKNDLAIFARGGFQSSSSVTFDAANPDTNLYWVVPYNVSYGPAAPPACTSPSIATDNQFSTTSNVAMLLYDPCDINFSSNTTFTGQIYGASNVTIQNRFNMKYRPVPIFGVDPTSLPALSYRVDVMYKREIQ